MVGWLKDTSMKPAIILVTAIICIKVADGNYFTFSFANLVKICSMFGQKPGYCNTVFSKCGKKLEWTEQMFKD